MRKKAKFTPEITTYYIQTQSNTNKSSIQTIPFTLKGDSALWYFTTVLLYYILRHL